jgi:UDP-2,3-diacylglucosamine hydrolase
VSSLFISDLHLTDERPAANEQFIDFLEGKARAAEALYILGDFFEYWIGDDDLEEPFNAVMAGLLRRLTGGGVPLYLMHGNRDFLIGERFCAATGAQLLADPSVHDIQGVRTLLAHGDTLCTDDVDYQNWRRIARSPQWQREFLA